MIIKADKLLSVSTDTLWDTLTGDFTLEFSNNMTLETNAKATIYSSYMWDFHRMYPRIPLMPWHHIHHHGSYITMSIHRKLLQDIFWLVVDTYEYGVGKDRDVLLNMLYVVVNKLYNDSISRMSMYVVSYDILDYLEIAELPEVLEVNANLKPNNKSITAAYANIEKTLRTNESISNNPLSRSVKSSTVKVGQLIQILTARGNVTDVDGKIYPTPILRGYLEGFSSLYEILTESRSAIKALFFSTSQIALAEYFARKLQLITVVFERVYPGDCGSIEYLQWHVYPEQMENGYTKYNGDLPNLIGKYYLTSNNTLRVITKKDTHLIGKTIQLRSVLFCKHIDKHGCCSICFGQLSDNLSPSGNVGHQLSAILTQKVAQTLLSAKHFLTSSLVTTLYLDDVSKRFFNINKHNSGYLLRKQPRGSDIKLIINNDETHWLSDIEEVKDIDELNPFRVTELSNILMRYTESYGVVDIVIDVVQNGRKASLSQDMLKYIKKYGWETEPNGNFVISLSDWILTEEILCFPIKESNLTTLPRKLSSLIESKSDDLIERNKVGKPVVLLKELFDLINTNITANIAIMEVIVYTLSIINSDNVDLPRGVEDPRLGIKSTIVSGRSLSNAMALDSQYTHISNYKSFRYKNRTDSPLDVYVCPDEMVNMLK